jgi:hypothetical protein
VSAPQKDVWEPQWVDAGRRIAALLDGVSAVAVVGDNHLATASATIGVARTQALLRRVFVVDLLGDASPLASLSPGADLGISDMIRYGVSISKVAVPLAESPNLFAISGGADTPLEDEVLTSPRWRTLSDLTHAAGALLLVAAPASAPALSSALRQLDGALIVEGASLPSTDIRKLGEIRAMPERPVARVPEVAPAAAPVVARRPPRWLVPVAALAAVAALLLLSPIRGTLTSTWSGSRSDSSERAGSVSPGALPDVPPPPARVQSEAAWSVEFLFTNSEADAMARAASVADSLPAATFSAPVIGADSAAWHRLVSGAFPDSLSAERFLALLRARGALTSGGVVLYTPFAFLVDSVLDGSLLPVKIGAYRGRGIPAYALRDSVGVWRIYAGAFATATDGALLKRRLDSLNIQSTLAVRVGSTS